MTDLELFCAVLDLCGVRHWYSCNAICGDGWGIQFDDNHRLAYGYVGKAPLL